MTGPVDPNHFLINDDGTLEPQPWMQWRCVATAEAPSVSGSYAVTITDDPTLNDAITATGATVGNLFDQFTSLEDQLEGILSSSLSGNLLGGAGQPVPATAAGGARNDLLYGLQVSWTNDTPINQWVYGMITRGGVRMTVQARTQAYILVMSGFAVGPVNANNPLTLTLSSAVGCGADIGLGGVLNIGTAYCIIEERQNGVSFPVQPEICGWTIIPPGQIYTAAVQIRYAAPFWETSSIDGGTADTETSYDDGGTRLDIIAVPVLPTEISPITWTNTPVTNAPVPDGTTGCFATLAGGGGGGAGGLSAADGGGGGGGGAATIGPVWIPVEDFEGATTYSVGLGLPGAAGAALGNGGDGTPSFFTCGPVALTASGGEGATGTTAGAGGVATVVGISTSAAYDGGAGGDGGTGGSVNGTAAASVSTGAAGGGGGGTGATLSSGDGAAGGSSADQIGGLGGGTTSNGEAASGPTSFNGGAGGGGGGGYGSVGTAGSGGEGGDYGGGGGGGGGKSGDFNVGVGGAGGPGGTVIQWV